MKRGLDQAFRVSGGGWYGDVEPGHLSEPGLDHVIVLRSAVGDPVGRPDDEMHRDAEHVVDLGALFPHSVHTADGEVLEVQAADRLNATEGGADARRDHGGLGDRY